MVFRHTLVALALGALTWSALPAAAQSPFAVQEAKLMATTPEQNRFFGLSVSLSGDRAIVGSFDGDGSTDTVPVFVRSGDTWVLEDDLLPTDGASGDRFGNAVSISGDHALVGAPGANSDGMLGTGAAYIFVRTGGTWTQEAKLTAPDAEAFDFFGDSVTLSGDRAFIGANGADRGTATLGQVFVFVRSGSDWAFEGELSPLDTPNSFGDVIAFSGDRALVGASGDDDDPRNDPFASGIGYVFIRSGSTWTQEDKLTVPERTISAQIAFSVALTDDRAMLGAPGEEDSRGAAYVFTRSGSEWAQEARLVAAGTGQSERFGVSVALAGDRAFVGASQTGQTPGAVYPFHRAAGVWTEQALIAATDGLAGEGFGGNLSLSGDRLLISATEVDGEGQFNVGAAYVFSDVFAVDAEGRPDAPTASLSAPRPNPSAGRAALVLSVETPRTVRAVVVDALGREVRVLADGEVSGATTLHVETATLAPGVYTIRVDGAATALTQRLTVVR